MRYVIPFNIEATSTGPAPDFLLSPNEGAGCTLRLHRGGRPTAPVARDRVERFALLLSGVAHLQTVAEQLPIKVGELAFIPAGQAGAVHGDAAAVWVDIEAEVPADKPAFSAAPRVMPVDPSRFEGGGFGYHSLIDRQQGANTMRMNVLQVQPGAGSPDYHIHAFTQIYIIQQGSMTLDVGRKRLVAQAPSLVVLPAGVVHRNFNASPDVERHVSLLVPEPGPDEIFDFAVTIHNYEAKLLERVPS